jgi:hypothetical protein
LIDATCVPVDIRYPTDLSLLNEAREVMEKLIDAMLTMEAVQKSQFISSIAMPQPISPNLPALASSSTGRG